MFHVALFQLPASSGSGDRGVRFCRASQPFMPLENLSKIKELTKKTRIILVGKTHLEACITPFRIRFRRVRLERNRFRSEASPAGSSFEKRSQRFSKTSFRCATSARHTLDGVSIGCIGGGTSLARRAMRKYRRGTLLACLN